MLFWILVLIILVIVVAAAAAIYPLFFQLKKPACADELYMPPRDPGLIGIFSGHVKQNWGGEAGQATRGWLETARVKGLKGVLSRFMLTSWSIVPLDPRDYYVLLTRHTPKRGPLADKPEAMYRDKLVWILGKSIINLPGDATHTRIRRLVNPLFSKAAVQNYGEEGFLNEKIQQLVREVESGDNTSFKASLEKMASAIITSLMFGSEHGETQSQLAAVYQKRQQYFANHVLLLGPPQWARPVIGWMDKKARSVFDGVAETTARIGELVTKIAREARDKKPQDLKSGSCKNLVDVIVEAQGAGGLLSEEEASALSIQIDFAGSETTAGTMLWCLIFLSMESSSALQEELAEELEEEHLLPRVPPRLSDVQGLPLLEACILETLRIAPAAAAVGREITDDVTLPSGLQLKRGDRVQIPIAALHTLPSLWGADSTDFKPKRWFESHIREMVSDKEKFGLPFMPFLWGTRACVGETLAMAEMKMTLATLVRTFRMSRAHPDEANTVPKKTLAFTTRPSFVPKLKFEPRK